MFNSPVSANNGGNNGTSAQSNSAHQQRQTSDFGSSLKPQRNMNGSLNNEMMASSRGSSSPHLHHRNQGHNGSSAVGGMGGIGGVYLGNSLSQARLGSSMSGGGMKMAYIFKCPECALLKNSCDDLEIHIKVEHLNWLPFQCPFCAANRASDTQMREHIHSHHKKSEHKYTYLDNPLAKRLLQEMMDQALFSASSYAASRSNNKAGNVNRFGGSGMANGADDGYSPGVKRARVEQSAQLQRKDSGDYGNTGNDGSSGGATVVAKTTSDAEELLAKLQAAVSQVTQQQQQSTSASSSTSNRYVADDGSIVEHGNNTDTYSQIPQRSVTEGPCSANSEGGGEDDAGLIYDDSVDARLSSLFCGSSTLKSEFDLPHVDGHATGSNLPDEAAADSMLHNMAQMFSAVGSGDDFAGGLDLAGMMDGSNDGSGSYGMGNGMDKKRAPKGQGSRQCVSKKRVLGQCSNCQKPITAGGRQMHMFFHLGKDHDTYRFRCKFVGCTVEHYRKDQMENHQAKVHGRVDADMMEDRSLELYNLCQKMSLELLGTTGNTPGPSAAQAQLLYDQQLKKQQESAEAKRRKRGFTGDGGGFHGPPSFVPRPNFNNSPFNSGHHSQHNQQKSNTFNNPLLELQRSFQPRSALPNISGTGGPSKLGSNYHAINTTPDLECLLCHKYIMNRIRGFHILWHLNNDLGIVRYSCRFCDFKHDRPQSVTTHGKKEHGNEKCLEDSLNKFEDEVKSMSKACFGVESLFQKELRRRSRLDVEYPNTSGSGGVISGGVNSERLKLEGDDEDDEAAIADQLDGIGSSCGVIVNPTKKAALQAAAAAAYNAAQQSRTSRRSTRRFGIRRPKSRKQKEEMAKLREVSMRIGGAQYFKKRNNENVTCEKCGKLVTSRLSQHAYSHIEGGQLYLCASTGCPYTHYSRDTVVKHLKDTHGSNRHPVDNRLKYAQEIKDAIRECYPSCFVDAPVPTAQDMEILKASLHMSEESNDLDIGDGDGEAEPDAETSGDAGMGEEDDEDDNFIADELLDDEEEGEGEMEADPGDSGGATMSEMANEGPSTSQLAPSKQVEEGGESSAPSTMDEIDDDDDEEEEEEDDEAEEGAPEHMPEDDDEDYALDDGDDGDEGDEDDVEGESN